MVAASSVLDTALASQPDIKLHGVLSCEPNDWVKLSLIGGLGGIQATFRPTWWLA
jgi:hypothetical protein